MAEVTYSNGDAVSAALLAGLGGYIVIEASGWDYMAPDGPGPGFFPMWYGIALVVLSLFVIGSRVIRMRRESGESGARGTRDAKRSEICHALGVWLAFTVSIAFLQVLGFMLAFGLLTLFIVGLIYRRPWKVAVAVAIATPLGFYLVFPLALSVSLPVGVFGI